MTENEIRKEFWNGGLDEAAQYFRIGRNTLRKIVADNPNADYLLWIGRKAQIKRTLFEKYIDQHNVV